MLEIDWKQVRRSSNSVWPLRGADGLTFAERKELQKKKETTNYDEDD